MNCDNQLIWEAYISEDMDPGQTQPPAIVQPADIKQDKDDIKKLTSFFQRFNKYNDVRDKYYDELRKGNYNVKHPIVLDYFTKEELEKNKNHKLMKGIYKTYIEQLKNSKKEGKE
jgi:hypothetical protein